MAVEIIEKKVLSSDGEHELAGRIYLPKAQARGLFQVVHGMTEHIARYDGFMRRLAEEGYIAFGYDHLGHGHTVRDVSELGFIAHKDGWKRLVDDVFIFADAVRKEYGETLPYTLMGHSMGSFIVRLAAAIYGKQDKLIVMGTGGPNPAAGVGTAIIGCIKTFCGERHISPFAEKLMFGSYNSHFGNDNPYNWLTSDPEIRKMYGGDPLCTFHFTSSALGDLVRLNSKSNKKKYISALGKEKPVLLISGSEDPVGDYGKGVTKVYELMKEAGVPVKMKLYEGCRHEIHNDTSREEVINDIIEFIK